MASAPPPAGPGERFVLQALLWTVMRRAPVTGVAVAVYL